MPVACQSSMTTPKAFELPAVACESLGDPGLKLVLHCITFSHYCERARWKLRLLGIPYDEVGACLVDAPAMQLQARKPRKLPHIPCTLWLTCAVTMRVACGHFAFEAKCLSGLQKTPISSCVLYLGPRCTGRNRRFWQSTEALGLKCPHATLVVSASWIRMLTAIMVSNGTLNAGHWPASLPPQVCGCVPARNVPSGCAMCPLWVLSCALCALVQIGPRLNAQHTFCPVGELPAAAAHALHPGAAA
jgi:hypothetical protein